MKIKDRERRKPIKHNRNQFSWCAGASVKHEIRGAGSKFLIKSTISHRIQMPKSSSRNRRRMIFASELIVNGEIVTESPLYMFANVCSNA